MPSPDQDPQSTANTVEEHELAKDPITMLAEVQNADVNTDEGIALLHDYLTAKLTACGEQNELAAYTAMSDSDQINTLLLFKSTFDELQAQKIADHNKSLFKSAAEIPAAAFAWLGTKFTQLTQKINKYPAKRRGYIVAGVGALTIALAYINYRQGQSSVDLGDLGASGINPDGSIDPSAIDGFDGSLGFDTNGDGSVDYTVSFGEDNDISGIVDSDGNEIEFGDNSDTTDKTEAGQDDGSSTAEGQDDGGGAAEEKSDSDASHENQKEKEAIAEAEAAEALSDSIAAQFEVEPGSSITREIIQLYESNGIKINDKEAYKIFLELKDEVGARNIIDLMDTDGVKNDVYRFMTPDGVNDVRISAPGIAEWTGDTQKFFEADLSDRLDIDMSSTTADAVDPSQTTDTSAATGSSSASDTPHSVAPLEADALDQTNEMSPGDAQSPSDSSEVASGSSNATPAETTDNPFSDTDSSNATPAETTDNPFSDTDSSNATPAENIQFEDEVSKVQAGDSWSEVFESLGVESDKDNTVLIERLGPWLEEQGLATQTEAGELVIANNVSKLTNEQLTNIVEVADKMGIDTNY